ncbi:hypothetical protein ACFXMT_03140 [Streptomyces mirabilis]|uniref:hypothetical protein n=1 Tax=Streptomyces mirabilis TaxID=68239 RepID=UPI0036992A5A
MTENALEKARKAAEAAAAKLAEAEAAEAARQAEIAAQRRKREREYSEGFLSRWSELASDAAAHERVSDYDPGSMGFLEGVIRMATAREKRTAVLTEAQRAENVLAVPVDKRAVPDSRHYTLDILGHLEEIIRSEVERRTAVFADALTNERESYVNVDGS